MTVSVPAQLLQGIFICFGAFIDSPVAEVETLICVRGASVVNCRV